MGAIILTPFVYDDLSALLIAADYSVSILFAASAIILIASIIDFEALKKGKIAVVEPLWTAEVPISAILAFLILNEVIGLLEIFLVAMLISGLVLVSLKSRHLSKKTWVEKGVVLALIGAVLMGASNFFIGFASRVTDPLMAIWFTNFFMAGISLFYLMSNHRLHRMYSDFRAHKKFILTVSVLDNLAWISFAFAMSLIPITIAVALSESYIALAALLGLLINKEKLLIHQKFGLVVTLMSAIALAAIAA